MDINKRGKGDKDRLVRHLEELVPENHRVSAISASIPKRHEQSEISINGSIPQECLRRKGFSVNGMEIARSGQVPVSPEVEKYRRVLYASDRHACADYLRGRNLIPKNEIEKISLWLCNRLVPIKQLEAKRLVPFLIGGFTQQQVHDPEVFVMHLEWLFAEYPDWACEETVREFPRQNKWLDIVTVSAMLESKIRPDKFAQCVVLEHRFEHARRDKERAVMGLPYNREDQLAGGVARPASGAAIVGEINDT